MSIIPGISYNIANVQSGQVFHLSDNGSIVTKPIDSSSDSQLWVLAPVNGGTRWTIQSVQTGQSIGLVGAPREGAGLVVGDSGFARPWTIVPLASAGPAVSRLPEGIFRISLVGTDYVVQSPNGNTDPGTPVQLTKLPGGDNQLWQFVRIDD